MWKKLGDNNLKATIHNTDYDRSIQVENVEYLNYLGSLITNYARRSQEIKSRIFMATAPINRKMALFTSQLDLNFSQKLVNFCIWRIAFCGAEIWTLRQLDQKYLKIFEMWCCRRMYKISLRIKINQQNAQINSGLIYY